MPCFVALLRAAILAAAFATTGASALAETGTATPSKPAQKKLAALHTGQPPQVKAVNVTRVASAPRVPRQAQRPSLRSAGDHESVKRLINHYAQHHGVPATLAHRIVIRESGYNPAAMSRLYFGLMQISLPTARQMGYTGAPQGLLDARTNLTYGMAYLANAWLVSGGNEDRALSLYSRGYYNDAKRLGLLRSLRQARSIPVDAEFVASAR